MSKYEIHPVCAAFPEIHGDEYRELRESLKTNGQLEPCWVWGKYLIDGKNRERACEENRQKVRYEQWSPVSDDPERQDAELVAFVLAKNLHRRHLTESQRAMIAARLPGYSHGGNRKNRPEMDQETNSSLENVAEALNVGTTGVKLAKTVLDSGSAAVVKAVDAGDIAVSDAAKIVDLPKSEQDAALRAVRDGDARTLAAAAKQIKAEEPAEEELFDGFRRPVPKNLRAVFESRADFRRLQQMCRELLKELHNASLRPGAFFMEFSQNQMDIENLKRSFRFAMPHTPCGKCRGKPNDKCVACKGQGWTTESHCNSTHTDEDLKWLEGKA